VHDFIRKTKKKLKITVFLSTFDVDS